MAKTNKHGRRCKCDDCSEKRSSRKWNKRKIANAKRKAKEKKEWLDSVSAGSTTAPSFLAGGHHKLKRDFTFEDGEFTEPMSSLHRGARSLIKNQFPKGVRKESFWNPIYDPFKGWKLYRAYQMDMKHDKFNNIEGNQQLLWHGTQFFSVSSIGHNSLEVRGSHCLLGAGIYLGNFDKAWMFSGGWGSNGYRTTLLCATKLGKVLDSNNSASHAPTCKRLRSPWGSCDKECKYIKPNASNVRSRGFDSAAAGRGYHPGAHGSRLIHSEYCAYDAERVLPLYVCVFKKEVK